MYSIALKFIWKGKREIKRFFHSLIGSLLKCSQPLKLKLAEARSLEFDLVFPREWQGSNYPRHYLLPLMFNLAGSWNCRQSQLWNTDSSICDAETQMCQPALKQNSNLKMNWYSYCEETLLLYRQYTIMAYEFAKWPEEYCYWKEQWNNVGSGKGQGYQLGVSG